MKKTAVIYKSPVNGSNQIVFFVDKVKALEFCFNLVKEGIDFDLLNDVCTITIK